MGDDLLAETDHAWLVVLGYFAQTLKLTDLLSEVPLSQRQGRDGAPPQHKLIEFLVGILGGIEQALNLAAQPIATDRSVAQAWEQAEFRHYSQVSRTLAAADAETLVGVIAALRQASAPFIQASVAESLKQQGHLTLDIDLTGRPVSPTSENYPEAAFGWMDDGVSNGYQAAITALVSERWQRLLLTLQRYPGRALSADCLQAAVLEAETTLQVRPRRRVELVAQANPSFITALGQVKTLVKVATRCRARWLRQLHGHTLIFDDAGPFAGTVLRLTGQVAVQLPLRLFNFVPS